MTTKKSKVTINAGVTVFVNDKKFTCTGSNEVNNKTPAQVMKSIQDCIDKAAASSKARRR